MPIQCMAGAVLASAMVGLAEIPANAAPVGTRIATLVSSGSSITVSDDYFLVSKWFALGAVIWAVVFPALAIHFAIRLYKHYNLGLHLAFNIGMAAIGLPPSVTIFAEQFGFLKVDGGVNAPSAWIVCTSVVCMTIMNSIKHLFAPQSLGLRAASPPQQANGTSDAEPPKIPHESLSQIFVEKIVEEGMPHASAVVRYLIGKVEKIEGDDVYAELPEKLRSSVYNHIVNEHDIELILQILRDSAPEGTTLRKSAANRLVSLCRNSARNKIQRFIEKVELFRTELIEYHNRAKPNEQTTA